MQHGTNTDVEELYEQVCQVKYCQGDGYIRLGQKGTCRYCGTNGPQYFKQVAHTFPEALGNKKIVTLDECDSCNQKFSAYEDALVKAVGPLLTLGGAKGKGNKIRQTGRSAGNEILRRHEEGEFPSLSMSVKGRDQEELVGLNFRTGDFVLKMPLPLTPFRPRFAYKALVKMGLALLPKEDLVEYSSLLKWLQQTEDRLEFPYLEVAFSYGALTNTLPLVTGTILRRRDPCAKVPNTLFVFSTGSLSFQIDLMPDRLDDHLPPSQMGTINLRWQNVIGHPSKKNDIVIRFCAPTHLNWMSWELEPQPFEALQININRSGKTGAITPILRS